jgi:hypothetical protein
MSDGYPLQYPTATAGRGQRVGQTSRFRCRWCGFINDARRRANNAPENATDGNAVTVDGDGIPTITVNAYCSLCGQPKWRRGEANLLNISTANRPQRIVGATPAVAGFRGKRRVRRF